MAPAWTRRRWLVAAGAAGGAGVVGGLGLLVANERHALRIRHSDVGAVPQAAGVRAPAMESLRIVQLSDLHLRDDPAFQARIHAVVRDARPDVLALTGDMVDRSTPSGSLARFLSGLPAVALKVAVPGNHEHMARVDFDAIGATCARHGVRFLRDEAFAADVRGRRLHVLGVDAGGDGRMAVAHGRSVRLPDADGLPVLVLAHYPASAVAVAERLRERPALLLAGHTHGGQVLPFGRVLVVPPGSHGELDGRRLPLFDGPLAVGQATAYVSTGIGTSGISLRLGVPPTLDVIDWRMASA